MIQLDGVVSNSLGQPLAQAVDIYATLSESNIVAIKNQLDIGTTTSNTILSTLSGSFSDLSGHYNHEQSLLASQIIPDSTPTSLITFDLDMNANQIVFTFDDVVNISSAQLTSVSLQNNIIASQTVPLTNGTILPPNDFAVRIYLDSQDVISIKANTFIATSVNNSYLILRENAFLDPAGQNVVGIPDGAAIQVSRFTQDSTPPLLVLFNLDMNLGSLFIWFNEPIDESTVRIDYFSIQDSVSPSSSIVNLTTDSQISLIYESTVLSVVLSEFDLNSIKSDILVATGESNTYLSFRSAAVSDVSGIPIESITGEQVTNFTADTTSPNLFKFTSFDSNTIFTTCQDRAITRC